MSFPIGPGGGGGDQQTGWLSLAPSGAAVVGNIIIGSSGSISIVATNTGNGPLTITSASVTGAEWSIAPTFRTLLAGASTTFIITLTPTSAGAKTSIATFAWSNGDGIAPPFTINLSGTGLVPGGNVGVFIPAALTFPNTQINRINQLSVVIKNVGANLFNVTGLADTVGAHFVLAAFPTLPFAVAVGASVALVAQFQPTTVGLQTDILTATTDIAGSITLSETGLASLVVPVAIASAGIRNLVIGGYDVNGVTGDPAPLQVDPISYDSDQVGVIVFNGALWEGLGQEKTLLRLGFYYENFGVVTLTGALQVYRPQGGVDNSDIVTFSITFGTVSAAKTTRYAEVDVVATGEIISLSMNRASTAGPVSIIAIVPYFEPRGEKVRES